MRYLKFLWIPLALISSLSGPLNPGISLVVSLIIFMFSFSQNNNHCTVKSRFTRIKLTIQKIPNEYYFYLVPIGVFSLYSLYLGQYNSLNISNRGSLSVLYSKLPEGIYYSFTQKLGFPILFVILAINALIIRYKIWIPEGKKLLKTFKWIGFFALIYILLLPLGGYRSYRPYILRYDTILPITLCLMFIFAKTTMFIMSSFSSKQRYWYIPVIVFVIIIFTNSDEPKFDQNSCERNAICQIARSKEMVVKIDDRCTVLSWSIIENPQESLLNTKLLKIWRIIDEDKLYYQKTTVTSNPDSQ